MQVFHSLEAATQEMRLRAVAIGNFDGVHLGHQSLLRNLIRYSKSERLHPYVLTFYPHPIEVLNPKISTLERLTTTAEKLSLFENMGISGVLVQKFDTELAHLSPEGFFEKFVRRGTEAKALFVGADFHFGKDRTGDVATLKALCDPSKIFLHGEPPFLLDGKRVSSTAIRESVKAGNVKEAAELLGRPYFLTGRIRRGAGRGRNFGFPTANVGVAHDKVLPMSGVYVTKAWWQKQCFQSVTNVGTRPTVDSSGVVSVEAHLIGIDANLYDEELRVEFLERLREERRFPDIDALKKQIAEDVVKAQSFFGEERT